MPISGSWPGFWFTDGTARCDGRSHFVARAGADPRQPVPNRNPETTAPAFGVPSDQNDGDNEGADLGEDCCLGLGITDLVSLRT